MLFDNGTSACWLLAAVRSRMPAAALSTLSKLSSLLAPSPSYTSDTRSRHYTGRTEGIVMPDKALGTHPLPLAATDYMQQSWPGDYPDDPPAGRCIETHFGHLTLDLVGTELDNLIARRTLGCSETARVPTLPRAYIATSHTISPSVTLSPGARTAYNTSTACSTPLTDGLAGASVDLVTLSCPPYDSRGSPKRKVASCVGNYSRVKVTRTWSEDDEPVGSCQLHQASLEQTAKYTDASAASAAARDIGRQLGSAPLDRDGQISGDHDSEIASTIGNLCQDSETDRTATDLQCGVYPERLSEVTSPAREDKKDEVFWTAPGGPPVCTDLSLVLMTDSDEEQDCTSGGEYAPLIHKSLQVDGNVLPITFKNGRCMKSWQKLFGGTLFDNLS